MNFPARQTVAVKPLFDARLVFVKHFHILWTSGPCGYHPFGSSQPFQHTSSQDLFLDLTMHHISNGLDLLRQWVYLTGIGYMHFAWDGQCWFNVNNHRRKAIWQKSDETMDEDVIELRKKLKRPNPRMIRSINKDCMTETRHRASIEACATPKVEMKR